MAWCDYYINLNFAHGAEGDTVAAIYESNIPPHGSVRREWNTFGMRNGDAKILFVEYILEDDDPDGVWEAYGMKRESEYSFTVDNKDADPEKLFAYTLNKDGTLYEGLNIVTDDARAILVFAEPQNITAEQLLSVAEKAEKAPRTSGAVEEIVIKELLNGADGTPCLAFFNR